MCFEIVKKNSKAIRSWNLSKLNWILYRDINVTKYGLIFPLHLNDNKGPNGFKIVQDYCKLNVRFLILNDVTEVKTL